MQEIDLASEQRFSVKLETISSQNVGDTLEYRILLLDSGVEKERISVTPLFVKEEVKRDGVALANQVADSKLSVVMYVIALLAISYAVWTMVQIRKMRNDSDTDENDQTDEVEIEMTKKIVPEINQLGGASVEQSDNLAAVPPLPPTGLPAGWTMEQWNHYGEQYLESLSKDSINQT
tara:strand:- start:62 stop:592 length:531 start_codon:yes stop_codon:yes gene_type:complete